MSEWYCDNCRKWNARSVCTACLRINPSDTRWLTEREIRDLRAEAVRGDR